MKKIPLFCNPITNYWPFPIKLANTALFCCTFDTLHFTDQDYSQSKVELPDNLTNAITKRKAEYLAGRLCAQQALHQLDRRGTPRPQNSGSPLWPPHCCGSISHTKHTAACIAGLNKRWQSLGLDIETCLNIDRSERLMNAITTPFERTLIKRAEQPQQLITLIFSIKESLFKALYQLTQKRFYFEHAQVLEWSNQGNIKVELLTTLSSRWGVGTRIEGQFALENKRVWSLIAIPHPR